eukprot:TRINITY_DN1272_c0_g1_i1.p1 TRINITY_DN1272_c0_g1~~TRINITY_DN1272_c0_g1_i1.p1  ORF type:complete len:484 (+),score=70.71 TRINITY_DN1272_c0_g1_i1:196-1452(+)
MKSEIGILTEKLKKLAETSTLADAIAALNHKKSSDKEENIDLQKNLNQELSSNEKLDNHKDDNVETHKTKFSEIQQYQFPVCHEPIQKHLQEQTNADNYANLMESMQEVGDEEEEKDEGLHDLVVQSNEICMKDEVRTPQEEVDVKLSQEMHTETWQDTIAQRIKELEQQQQQQVQQSEMQSLEEAIAQRVKELEQESHEQQQMVHLTSLKHNSQDLEDNDVNMEEEGCIVGEQNNCEGDMEIGGFEKVMEATNKKRKLLLGNALRVTEDLNNNYDQKEGKEVDSTPIADQESAPKIQPIKKWDTSTFKGLQLEAAWKLHNMLLKIQQQAERGALLLVLTGHGNTGEVRRLSDMKNRCEKLFPLLGQSRQKLEQLGSFDTNLQSAIDNAPQWTTELQHQLDRLLDREILGLCFCKVID